MNVKSVLQKEILTSSDIANLLQISERNVRKLLEAEKIKGFKVGKLWRVEQTELQNYLRR